MDEIQPQSSYDCPPWYYTTNEIQPQCSYDYPSWYSSIQPQSSYDCPSLVSPTNEIQPQRSYDGSSRYSSVNEIQQFGTAEPKAGILHSHIDLEGRIFEEIVEQRGKIFRVHKGLTNSKPEAYKPMLISIGPYHRNDKNPMALKHKELCFELFCKRNQDFNIESCKNRLSHKLEDATKSYGFPALKCEDTECFCKMLLHDACFIIAFVHERWESRQREAASSSYRITERGPKGRNGCCIVELDPEHPEREGDEDASSDMITEETPKARNSRTVPIFSFNWMYAQASRDLLLFENQLPYFVLLELHGMSTHTTAKCSFNDMVMCALKIILLEEFCFVPISESPTDLTEIKHLLHAVHILCCPPSPDDYQNPDEDHSSQYRAHLDQMLIATELLEHSSKGKAHLYQMRSATLLRRAGIRFKKGNRSSGIFDIEFDAGVMKIPSLTIVDSTESLFRNLIAYEQYSPGLYPKFFSDYAIFMGRLINSSKDVGILRHKGILVNSLGDDEMVAKLFKNLGDGVIVSSRFYYSKVFETVNEHCKIPWNTTVATLRRRYWSGWTVLGAVIFFLYSLGPAIGKYVVRQLLCKLRK